MSVPAFGFSAGDFIAAVGLAVNVTNALKDVGGASEQYRILVQELNSLERVVRKLHARQGTENSFPEDITKQTDMTLETLGSFLKTISKFNSKLGPNAASGWHHGVGRKAQWAVAYAKEVEKLRVKLGTHLAQLNMLLQIYASARVEALAKTLASIPPAIEAQDTQMLALQQETSTNIDNLGSQIQQFGSSQEAILHRQHSVVLARFQAARDDIQQGHGHITTLGGSIDAQTQQLAALRQDAQVYHSTIRSRIEEAHQHTQQGMQLLSRQSDLILYAVSQPGRTESMRAEGKDDVFFLLFQLLRAISKSMGNLLWKAGLILPFILSAVERMTNTIRRQPYLLVEDSINFTDMQGKKYTMHYDYFRHWSHFESFFYDRVYGLAQKKMNALPPGSGKTLRLVTLDTPRGRHLLPLKSHDHWKVAPGDQILATLELRSLISYAYDARGNARPTNRSTRCLTTITWLPRQPIVDD